jgi:GNAT superfamily N-acetyltransferase
MTKILNLRDKPELLETLARWHQGEWSQLNPGETLEQRIIRMQPFLNGKLIPNTYVAFDDVLYGSAAIVESDMDSRPDLSPWLASVFVIPDYRNQGIGSALVRHVMQQAQQDNIEKLYLYTADRKAFYYKLGWRRIDEENYHGHEVSIMEADLTSWKPVIN